MRGSASLGIDEEKYDELLPLKKNNNKHTSSIKLVQDS